MQKLSRNFFKQDVLTVAPALLGKFLVRKFEDGHIERYRITEVEACRGEMVLLSCQFIIFVVYLHALEFFN
ncbi:hypothetical protein FACS1894155_08900 [Bacteroidia bacterium]|nr:hypothetical protein FACS1894155_08900 [Bacteroidia bacterium]